MAQRLEHKPRNMIIGGGWMEEVVKMVEGELRDGVGHGREGEEMD